jgi:hypothetical protein
VPGVVLAVFVMSVISVVTEYTDISLPVKPFYQERAASGSGPTISSLCAGAH